MKPSLETEVMAHRYLYYVLAAPVIPDYVYDELERSAIEAAKPESRLQRPGSDRAEDYTVEEILRARKLLHKSLCA
jgi:NAD-dependent DNA ligase